MYQCACFGSLLCSLTLCEDTAVCLALCVLMDVTVVSSLGLLVIKFVLILVIEEIIQFFTCRYGVSSDFFTDVLFQLEEDPLVFLDY